MVFKMNLAKIEYSLKEKIVNIINMLKGKRPENDGDDEEEDENSHNAGSNSSDSNLEENV